MEQTVAGLQIGVKNVFNIQLFSTFLCFELYFLVLKCIILKIVFPLYIYIVCFEGLIDKPDCTLRFTISHEISTFSFYESNDRVTFTVHRITL